MTSSWAIDRLARMAGPDAGREMAEHIIPSKAGPYHVAESLAGTPLVVNERTGKTKVRIPCRSREQAEEICRRLNADEHDGVIRA